MGTNIEFPTSTGDKATGYLAEAGDGAPGILVIQEWWGLVPQIERTCDRFASAGLTALAPDLYGGTKVPLDEPDEAAKAMMAMRVTTAAADLSGAVDELAARTGRDKVGAIGYCMGGGLALKVASDRGDAVAAVAPCYGVYAWEEGVPDYAAMTAAVQIHCAALDGWFTVEVAEQLTATLKGLGRDVELFVYDGVDHAFANDERDEVYDAAAASLLFERTSGFFISQLG
jgi:carboxymethylenebutenolidase